MNKAIVTLKKGEGRMLKSGGAWIFDNEIESVMGNFDDGDIVLVHDFDGYPLGRGFINRHSKIRVRMLTRNIDQEINEAFAKRLRDAWEYRKKTVDISSCRIVFGEADFLPGMVIDKFSDVLVFQALALGIDRYKELLIRILREILQEDGIWIHGVYERSDAKEREKEGLSKVSGFFDGKFDTDVEIVENGVRYLVDVKDGQKTGFFLDQKYNRLAIQRLCKDAKVLDCFTHTGSFALNAVLRELLCAWCGRVGAGDKAGGEKRRAQRTFRSGEIYEPGCICTFCRNWKTGGEIDMVILDPPAFTKVTELSKKCGEGL